MSAHRRLSACPRYPCFCIDDDKRFVDAAAFDERRQAEKNRCRKTSWIGYILRRFNVFPIQLRQSVYRFLKHVFRRGFPFIPLFIDAWVLYPEIAGQINDGYVICIKLWRQPAGYPRGAAINKKSISFAILLTSIGCRC